MRLWQNVASLRTDFNTVTQEDRILSISLVVPHPDDGKNEESNQSPDRQTLNLRQLGGWANNLKPEAPMLDAFASSRTPSPVKRRSARQDAAWQLRRFERPL